MPKSARIAAVATAVALALTACGSAVEETAAIVHPPHEIDYLWDALHEPPRDYPTPEPEPSPEEAPEEEPEESPEKAPEKPSEAPVEPADTAPEEEPVPPSEKPSDEPTAEPTPEPEPSPEPTPENTGTTISDYAECGADYQRCIDAGNLTYYVSVGKSTGHSYQFLAGHDYMGYAWLSSAPVGTTVTVSGGSAAGTYTVIGHHYIGQQGGTADLSPMAHADLVLQACQGAGTGFSLMRRI